MARPLTVAGVFAHPDHRAVTAATHAAFAAYAATPREREPRFYWWGTPVSDMRSWRALCRHRTQAGDPAYRLLGRETWRRVFARSQFIRVHPAPGPDDPPETSLVEAFPNG